MHLPTTQLDLCGVGCLTLWVGWLFLGPVVAGNETRAGSKEVEEGAWSQ